MPIDVAAATSLISAASGLSMNESFALGTVEGLSPSLGFVGRRAAWAGIHRGGAYPTTGTEMSCIVPPMLLSAPGTGSFSGLHALHGGHLFSKLPDLVVQAVRQRVGRNFLKPSKALRALEVIFVLVLHDRHFCPDRSAKLGDKDIRTLGRLGRDRPGRLDLDRPLRPHERAPLALAHRHLH